MLRSLRVRNIAIAENVAVEFGPGLNVITGETGAGKSILVGALALLLGERADRTLIRTGEESASVEAVLEPADCPAVDALLDELGLPRCEDGQLVIRRTVRASGSGQAFVNDSPVTVQALRQLGEQLVDMHGPHEHQSLFRPSTQLAILDAFSCAEPERAAYQEIYQRIRELEQQRAELTTDPEGLQREMEWLDQAIREIESVDPKPGEEEQLAEEHRVVGSAQRILELAGECATWLTDGDAAAYSSLVRVQRALDELARLWPTAVDWRAEALRLTAGVQELALSISREASRIEADPGRLEWLSRRLADYQRLHRKYGATVQDILQTLERSRQRLEELRGRGERLAEIQAELERLQKELWAAGERLRSRRVTGATELAEAVTGELEFLGFGGAAFSVRLEPTDPQADGMDRVEFMFAPNVGEESRPLRAIASSGEISRLMLAIKAVVAEQDRVPILVFDEIDANLGGTMAHSVGLELAGVAHRRQVLCITHLPQVAAHGDHHYAVRKVVRDGRTYTEVARLDERARIEELARMLGGPDSVTALAHAADLLQRARRARSRPRN